MSESIPEEHPAGFTRPNILLSAINENGITTLTVREGAVMSFIAKTTREETDELPDEKAFGIAATNRINFGGAIINVINDECNYGDVHLNATSPTASEYMALVGKEIVTSMVTYPNAAGRATGTGKRFIVGRTRIILP